MKKKIVFPVVGILILCCIIFIFVFEEKLVTSIPLMHSLFAPLQKGTYVATQHITNQTENGQEITNQNNLQEQIRYKQLQEDNTALRDQFQTASIPPNHLLPAHIIGEPGFIPGNTAVETFTLDKGSDDGMKVGMIVIYKDTILGKIQQTSHTVAQAIVISNDAVSFSAKTFATNALGVVKGQGGGTILLDNVILSQTLKLHDIVETKGDMDIHGNGYPPNLIVGRIVSIQKDPSALFQKASIQSLVDITKLDIVFVMMQK